MSYEQLQPVIWRGELVALAGRERFYIVSPRLRAPDAAPADVEYVALLCLYERQVMLGRAPRSADPGIAERWVDRVLELRAAGVSG